jgi:hypothetical protein
MYFISLLLVVPTDTSRVPILIHGLGTRPGDDLPTRRWSRHVTSSRRLYSLERWTVVLDYDDVNNLTSSMSNDLFSIGPNQERVVQGGLHPRPAILTDSKPVTTATSFTGRTERHYTWIRREKHQFVTSIRSILSPGEATNEELTTFLRQASSECAIHLDNNLARLGNFELIEPLVGSYSSARIFECSSSRPINGHWEATLTFQDSVAARTVAYARVRLRGGLGQADGAVIFDRIFTCENHQPLIIETRELEWPPFGPDARHSLRT